MRIHRVGRILKLVHLLSPQAQNHHKSTQNSNMRENSEVDLHSGVIAAGKTIKPQSIYKKQILARLGTKDNKVRKEDQVRTIPKEYTSDG